MEGIALTIGALFAIIGLYAAMVAGGALLQSAGDGLPHTRVIQIYSSPVHADIILPVVDDVADWRHLAHVGGFRGSAADQAALAAGASHVAIGWGAESFYRNVRLLSDVRLRHLLDGIWDDSLLHVSYIGDPSSDPNVVNIALSEEGYRQLIADIQAEFTRKDAAEVALPGESYWTNDAFFEAEGSYHPLRTCNEWVGEKLRAAGVVVGRFTPFSQTLTISLGSGDMVGE